MDIQLEPLLFRRSRRAEETRRAEFVPPTLGRMKFDPTAEPDNAATGESRQQREPRNHPRPLKHQVD